MLYAVITVVQRCCEFAPDKRYPTAEKAKKALLRADRRKGNRALRLMAAGATCIAFLCAGFALGRYTDIEPFYSPDKVRFSDVITSYSIHYTKLYEFCFMCLPRGALEP